MRHITNLVRAFDLPARHVNEHGYIELGTQNRRVKGALDGVVIANHGAVRHGLGHHFHQHSGRCLRTLHRTLELILVKERQAG